MVVPRPYWHGVCRTPHYVTITHYGSALKKDRTRMIEDLITRYIADHPHAADTVEGICNCWVAPDLPDVFCAEVQVAAGRLVARGTLVQSALPEGTLFSAPVASKNGRSVH